MQFNDLTQSEGADSLSGAPGSSRTRSTGFFSLECLMIAMTRRATSKTLAGIDEIIKNSIDRKDKQTDRCTKRQKESDGQRETER